MKKALIGLALIGLISIPASAQIAISQLPTAAVPLQGNEVVAGVQNGQTVQIPETAFGIQGPASAVSGHVAVYDGTTGKAIKDSTAPNISAATATSITFGGSVLGSYSKTSPTVTLSFGGTSTGITYSTRVATCTQIGDVVTCNVDIILSSKGSSTGLALISGVPTSASTGGGNACSIFVSNMAAGLTTQAISYIPTNSAGIVLDKMAAGTTTAIIDTDFTNTSEVIVTCAYHTTGT